MDPLSGKNASGADDGVAVDQTRTCLRVDIPIGLRHVARLEFPHCFLLGVDFAREDILLVCDQRIPVLKSDGGPRARDLVLPDLLEIPVVLNHLVHRQEGNEVRSLGCVPHPAELSVDGLRVGQARGREVVLDFHNLGLSVDVQMILA